MRNVSLALLYLAAVFAASPQASGEDRSKPYSLPCTEREEVFEFTEKPALKVLGDDRYEITFAVKACCDVTVGLEDEAGRVVRHLGSGVLGANAPAPFLKNSLKQAIVWNGKDDLDQYPKEPSRLRVRVALGLKPSWDKRLGPDCVRWTSFKPLAGIAVDESGVFVLINAKYRLHLRKFDHDGNYLCTPFPPPAGLPLEKMKGLSCIEYEPGKQALHAQNIHETASWGGASYLPKGGMKEGQPVLSRGRLYYITASMLQTRPALHYINADGSTDLTGFWRTLGPSGFYNSWLAASPDGKRLYLTGEVPMHAPAHGVYWMETDGQEKAKLFAGDPLTPGSDPAHFNEPRGVGTDAQGRVYICDIHNNRIQVYSPESKFLKSIPIDKPELIQVHRKSGALYVRHSARVAGKGIGRISKLASFDRPEVECFRDELDHAVMALDSWTERPRLWLWRVEKRSGNYFDGVVTLWEERGKTFEKIRDHQEEARKAYGPDWFNWDGCIENRVFADPVRERVISWGAGAGIFDLPTGKLVAQMKLPGTIDDVAADKRGYYHLHLDPGYYQPGVGRLDPERIEWVDRGRQLLKYLECPYDYGEESKNNGKQGYGEWMGLIPVKDQPGANFFQGGIGANMSGDIVVESNIWNVPKMDDLTLAAGWGSDPREACKPNSFANYQLRIKEAEKQGEEIYFIRRRQGVPLVGATLWTYDRTGELRTELAANLGGGIDGCHIDEEGMLYTVFDKRRLIGGEPFLAGRGGTLGDPADRSRRDPWTSTLAKTRGKDVVLFYKEALVPLEETPKRAPDVERHGGAGYFRAWLAGAEWLYAGAAMRRQGCLCPKTRFWTDWYKRSFVSEQYRHSIGVLDTAGNLVLHLGRYGNLDSADGPRSKVPVGGDGIAITHCSFVTATDEYLVFDDECNRLIVAKLGYHAEETVPVKMK